MVAAPLKPELNGLAPTASGQVPELYFPDERHAAGLRLFDLVSQIDLPDLPHAKARSREEENERSETHASDSLRASASPRETHTSPLRAFASSRESSLLATPCRRTGRAG